MAEGNGKAFGGVPAFVAWYDDPKCGKTCAGLFAAPCGIHVASKDAIKPAYSVVGYVPAQVEVATIAEVTAVVKAEGKARQYDAVHVDDFGLVVEREITKISKGNLFGAFWGPLMNRIIEFRDACRDSGLNILVNLHYQPPFTDKQGRHRKGGPKLPGDLGAEFVKLVDEMFHGQPAPGPMLGHPRVFRYGPTYPDHHTGGRHGTAFDFCPYNIGELIRAAGYRLRRAPGLEWQDDLAEKISEALLKPGGLERTSEILKNAVDTIKRLGLSDNPLHVRWALRDGVDRSIIARAKANPLASYLEPPKALVGTVAPDGSMAL